jgi:hypothetical protein
LCNAFAADVFFDERRHTIHVLLDLRITLLLDDDVIPQDIEAMAIVRGDLQQVNRFEPHGEPEGFQGIGRLS